MKKSHRGSLRWFKGLFFGAFMLFFCSIIVGAASIGPNSPSSGASVTGTGSIAWTNPSYITGADTNYAVATNIKNTAPSVYLHGTGYGFTIPTGAAINGIQVAILRKASNTNVFDANVHLLKSGAIVGSNYASGTAWSTSAVTGYYGSTSDLWGTTWTRADINRNNFGASLSVSASVAQNRTASVDYIAITVTYTPDTTPPTFSGVTTGAYYNTGRTITFSDPDLSGANLSGAILSGLDNSYYSGNFQSGSTITGTGKYIFTVYDIAGNSSGATFTIDKTQPIFSGVTTGAYYNTGRTITFSDANLSGAILSGLDTSYYSGNFQSGSTVTGTGRYLFTVYDKAGNSDSAIFTIDKTQPTFSGVTTGAYYNTGRTITFSDENLSGAILSGLDNSYYSGNFQSGSTVTGEGRYVFIVYDIVGNSTGATFTIDKTSPIFRGVTTGSVYNTGVSIGFLDTNPGYTGNLDGQPYASGTLITGASTHTFVVTDAAGNSTGATFTISYVGVTLITGSLLNISADNAADSSSGSAYSTLTNIIITEGSDGNFLPGTGVTLILTAPTNRKFKPGSGGITYKGGVDNIKSGSLAVTDSTITATLDIVGTDLPDAISITDIQVQAISGEVIPSDGYLLRTCGNPGTASIYNITCDTTQFYRFSQAPGAATKLILTLPGQTFVDGFGNSGTALNQTANVAFDLVGLTAVDQFTHLVTSYAGDKTISYTGSIDGLFITGVHFTNGQSTTTLTTTLPYHQTNISLSATDGSLQGVPSSLFDNIDSNPPSLTFVHISSDNSNSGALAKAGDIITIFFTGSEVLTGVTATIDASSATVTNLGMYDRKAEYTVTTGTSEGSITFLIGYSDLAATTGSTSATTDSSLVTVDLTSPTSSVVYAPASGTRTSGNVIATLTGYLEPLIVTNTSGGSLSYTFTSNTGFVFQFTDIVGNTGSASASVSRIDKQLPTFAGVISGHEYHTGVSITFSDDNPGVTATLSGGDYTGGEYISGTLITSSGVYIFVVTDAVGNTNGATFTITMPDTIPPTAYVEYLPASGSWTSGNVDSIVTGFNEDISRVNQTGYTFTDNSSFVYGFTDIAGNTGYATGIVTWIDRVVPTFSGIASGGSYVASATIYYADDHIGGAIISGLDNSYYDGSYTSATTITQTGIFLFTVYDLASNSTGAVFTITSSPDTTPPTLDDISISSDNTHTDYAAIGNLITVMFTGSEALSGVYVTIDGNVATISGSDLLRFGSYVMTLSGHEGTIPFTIDYFDLANNTGSQMSGTTDASQVIFDKTSPIFSGVSSGSSYATGVMIFFSDENPGVTATLNASPYTSGTLITGANTYTLIVTDTAGNTTGAIFAISYSKISITPADGVSDTLSADTADNALGGGSYTTLSDIILNEGAPTNFDQGTGTLILTAPDNRQFNPGSGNISCQLGARNIKSCSLVVTESTITATFFVSGSDLDDSVSIYNIQVQPITGNIIPSAGNILRTCSNPGTASIFGIDCDSTNFGNLGMVPGDPRNLIITLPGETFVDGVGNSGTALTQDAGVSFDIVGLTAIDQFSHIASSYAGSKTISYTGVSGIYTTAVSFSSGQSTTTLTTTLFDGGTGTLFITATDGTLVGIASSPLSLGDTDVPIITLSGSNPQNIEIGNPYAELGATAYDTGDGGDISPWIVIDSGTVNMLATGSYTVAYDVSDTHGNTGIQQIRTVNVVDTTPPVIIMSGSATMDIEVGSSFTDPGATASDVFYGDLTMSIITSGTVDPNTIGTYSITYDVTDVNGNDALQQIRTVNVDDTIPPVVTLSGSNPQYIIFGDPYVELGATAYDTGDGGDVTTSIVIDSGSVNLSATGSYSVSYTVVDGQGNTGQTIRTVNVIQPGSPVITLLGTTPITIEVSTMSYIDSGATAYDPEDGDITSSIVTSGVSDVNVNIVGTYYITYDVMDSSGNSAPQVTRTISIVDTTIPEITLSGLATVDVPIHSSYTDAGATAEDNYDGDLTSSIVTSGSVDIDTLGTYYITYDVTDSNANDAIQVVRTINVISGADLTDYYAAIAAVTESDFLSSSRSIYQSVVDANVVTNANSQGEVDAATANILAAQANLILKVTGSEVFSGNVTLSGTDTVINHDVGFENGVGTVILQSGLVIYGVDTGDVANLIMTTGDSSGLTNPGAGAIDIYMSSSPTTTLKFSEPVKIQVNVGTNSPVYPRIKHAGGDRGIDGLTTNSSATCTDGLPGSADRITLSTTVTPSSNIMTIYICSASTVSAVTSLSTSGGGGGSSSMIKDDCPDGDKSPSYYDGICTYVTQTRGGEIPGITGQLGNITNSPYSVELNTAYLYAFAHGLTTQSTILSADMEGYLLRMHMAKMITNYATSVLHKVPDDSLSCEFDDMRYESQEMQFYAKLACQLHLMGIGSDGSVAEKFNPHGLVTRAEFGTVLSRLLYGDEYDGGTPYYAKHLQALKAAGIMSHIENPMMKELRGYVLLMLMRASSH